MKIKGRVSKFAEGLWAFYPMGNSGHCGPIFRATTWNDAMILASAYYNGADSSMVSALCNRKDVLRLAKLWNNLEM